MGNASNGQKTPEKNKAGTNVLTVANKAILEFFEESAIAKPRQCNKMKASEMGVNKDILL